MMRSFGARTDTVVVDEPLYGYYLHTTGLDHPGRDQVIASLPRTWQAATEGLLWDGAAAVFYQKHMAHHLLPDVGREWLGRVTNAFLIRDPAAVIASYAKVRGEPTLMDLGLPQQVEIFRRHPGPVVDAADVLRDPTGVLERLCRSLGLEFDEAMLHWPPGRRPSDGVWAPYWYSAVEASTGFGPYDPTPPQVPDRLRDLVDQARPFYDELAPHRL
jgi:hypothetical protein